MKKPIAVLGLGNPLMADEGIGCLIIQHLQSQSDKFPAVDFIDAGTGGMSLLHLIADRRKVILIDCACMRTKPGTIKRFTPQDVESVKTLTHQSLHEADILKILAMVKQLDQYPQEVVIFGIEPETVEQRQGLSEKITKRMDNYISAISEELQTRK